MTKEINKIKARLRRAAVTATVFDGSGNKEKKTEFVTLEQALDAINDVVKELKPNKNDLESV